MSEGGFLAGQLLQRTSMFGLRLWVVISIGIGGFTLLILFLLSLRLLASSRSKSKKSLLLGGSSIKQLPNPLTINISSNIPPVSKDIKEVVVEPAPHSMIGPSHHLQQSFQVIGPKQWSRSNVAARVESKPTLNTLLSHPEVCPVTSKDIWDGEKEVVTFEYTSSQYEVTPHFHTVKSKRNFFEDAEMQMHVMKPLLNNKMHARLHDSTAENEKAGGRSTFTHETFENAAMGAVAGGWGQWYTLAELGAATNQFADTNIVGKGGYGVVYQGMLPHGSPIAVKNLLNSRGQAEKEFKVEVEAIGRVRHKNLVRLLGYCAEGSHRMLVYEYVNKGNLDQWLHGSLGKMNPVPWNARMKIVLGIAKGLAYLHEDLEPKVVHRDVKSSNILLDNDWNAKISDFGLAKLLGAGMSHVTTRVMGTFGYVAPEYASTGLLTERSDVYSFGVLMMELITGRDPVDYNRPVGEINLVDWMKMMVGSRRSEEVADPRLCEKPSSRALKRTLLVALRCVDPDALKRPRMGNVVHMLEADDVGFHKVCKSNPNTQSIKGRVM